MPPLVDKVTGAIKVEVSPVTAKSGRSVMSGVVGPAVPYGAVTTNSVREVDRIEARPMKEPRALSSAERGALLERLQADPKAQRHDLTDLEAGTARLDQPLFPDHLSQLSEDGGDHPRQRRAVGPAGR